MFTGDPNAILCEGSSFNIVKGGTYELSGKLKNGSIVIDAEGERVRLVLNGMEIYCESLTPIYIKNASEAIIETARGTKNTIECGNATRTAVSAKSKLTFINSGSLSLNGLFIQENIN